MQFPNIILIYGEDLYGISELAKKWKTAFLEKHGAHNLESLDGKNLEMTKIIEIARQFPFLSDKRMVYIFNFLRDGKKEEQKLLSDKLKEIPLSTILVLIEEGKIDSRLSLFKEIKKNCRIEEKPNKSGSELNKWIQQKFLEQGKKVDFSLANFLQNLVGTDTWRIQSEIKKISAYCEEKEIEEKDIELLSESKVQTTIFKFVDNIGLKNYKAAIKILQDLSSMGEDPLFIFHMIIRQIRLITLCKALLEKNISRPQIISQLKIAPFALNNTINQAKNFDFDKLKKLYGILFEIEKKIKFGKIKIQKDETEGFLLEIEKFIIEACL